MSTNSANGPAADMFSKQAAHYAAARPKYPAALFDFVCGLTGRREKAWDVATGSGQAVTELATRFDRVVATDISSAQISHAPKLDNVTYAVTPPVMAPADVERVVGPSDSVDLVTIAQALHWFDLDVLYRNIRQVLRKEGGVVAAWTYTMPIISPEIDPIHHSLYVAAQPYWDSRRMQYVEKEYRTIPFHFSPVPGKTSTGPFEFESSVEMDLPLFLSLLRSWSGVQRAKDKGVELVDEDFVKKLTDVWGEAEKKRNVKFTVFVLVGCV